MPVLSLISELQALIGPAQEHTHSHTLSKPPQSLCVRLFTFQWLDIPIRAAAIYWFPLCRVQSLISLLLFLSRSFFSSFDLLTHPWVASSVSSL